MGGLPLHARRWQDLCSAYMVAHLLYVSGRPCGLAHLAGGKSEAGAESMVGHTPVVRWL